jgi:hypothetical protein
MPVWVVKTSNYTAVNSDRILADTSAGSFTITLPSSPSPANYIEINDPEGTWGTNNLIIARNGSNISSLAEDLTCNASTAIGLTYVDATIGWKVDFIIELGGTRNVTRSLWIPASAWIPRTTAGCGINSLESSTNKINYDVLEFDPGAIEYAQAMTTMPSNWDGLTVNAAFYWTVTSGFSGSGSVVWQMAGRSYADQSAIDQVVSAAKSTTDAFTTGDYVHVSPLVTGITLEGLNSTGNPVVYEISRKATDASDTLAVDARLLGIQISYNT